MEQIGKMVAQQMNKLQVLSPLNSVAIQENEISVYSGILTTECVITNVAKVKKSFPTLPPGFYDVFADRLKANGFCDDRLTDAVNHVIDNCVYPTPTIANFISFDRTFKVFHYEQMLKKHDEFGCEIWNSYKPVQFSDRDKLVWVHVDDIKKYNLTIHTL